MSAEDIARQEDIHEEHYLDHEEILDEYRRRQMIEHLTGPMVSLFLHAVVVVACAVLMVGREVNLDEGVEFDTKELEVKPLDPETMEELDEIEEEVIEEIVPTVEKPTITPQQMDMETPDFSDANAVAEMELDFTMDIKMTTSPITLPGLYSSRTKEGREKALRTYGGPGAAASERAVLKALRWLQEHQEEDGSWSPRSNPEAMSGMALLAFLAHGETPSSEEFGATVQRGIQWLANRMLNKKGLESKGYSHGIATYALCEAYALTKIPFVKPAMEKGLERMISGQQPKGGFDYNYAKGKRWDLSVAAWQLQAMKAGYAAGATTPGLEDAMEKGINYLKNVAYANGKFGYTKAGVGSPAMQGAGTLCLQLLGAGKSTEAKSCVDGFLAAYEPDWETGGKHASYNWYYCTQAIFHGGSRDFKRWNASFAPMLIKHQQNDGHWVNPGVEPGNLGNYAPFKATALNALSLQVYYRYLPTYKVSATQSAAKTEDVFGFEGEEF
ncbi:MAG: prenyltransferase/squalene oxidase repeat-containing protein [Lentisphaeria bacterium]|nr:prenyltransferase/squalene oxidase repeat-containing protein [Lentisphaeria bacterium]